MTGIHVTSGFARLTPEERTQWVELFETCFKKSPAQAQAVFKKYEAHGNAAWFCLATQDGRLVASYAGVALPLGQDRVFLAMDTMSNGTLGNATAKLGKYLYEQLAAAGIDAVIGFPNQNIVSIRQRKLNWRMTGAVNLYWGLPFLWRCCRQKATGDVALWTLPRPATGFFSRPRPGLVLLGRDGPYRGPWLSLVISLAARAPGPFFFKVPERLVASKAFGFVMTNPANHALEQRILAASGRLDLETIDVP